MKSAPPSARASASTGPEPASCWRKSQPPDQRHRLPQCDAEPWRLEAVDRRSILSPDEAGRKIEANYPLTATRKGMHLESVAAPDSGVHIEQTVWRLLAAPDADGLKRVWEWAPNRRLAMRTAFVQAAPSEPLQVLVRDVDIPIEQHDWTDAPGIQDNRAPHR